MSTAGVARSRVILCSAGPRHAISCTCDPVVCAQEIDLGQVVIGNVKTEQVSFTNLGGPGRFRIVPEVDWPDYAADAPNDRAVVGPFKVRGRGAGAEGDRGGCGDGDRKVEAQRVLATWKNPGLCY